LKSISNYSQPDFYHFTEDSLELVEFASHILKDVEGPQSAVDLGAGCGVIGIEALLKIPSLNKMTFLEVQEPFIFHIKENLRQANIKSASVIHKAISELEGQFDLIFSNPPYFSPGMGRRSDQKERQVCRTFEVDGWRVFFEKISEILIADGLVFLCVRDDSKIKDFLKSFKIVKKKKNKAAILFCLARLDVNRS
jgi:tRNA1Val (adenine37-N6)-methyltransferase